MEDEAREQWVKGDNKDVGKIAYIEMDRNSQSEWRQEREGQVESEKAREQLSKDLSECEAENESRVNRQSGSRLDTWEIPGGGALWLSEQGHLVLGIFCKFRPLGTVFCWNWCGNETRDSEIFEIGIFDIY